MKRNLRAPWLLVTGIAGLFGPAAGQAPPRIDEPRPYGHVVGDLIERRIHLALPPGRALAADSLPRPARAGNWLELRRIDPVQNGSALDLTLTYQVVNAPQKVATIALPALALRLAGDPPAALPEISEWPVTLSPLTPEFVLARAGLEAMQPDILPVPEPVAPIAARLGLWLLLLLLASYVLALRRWPRLAFWRRTAPFRDALADLQRLARQPDAQAYRQALKRLHAAFDASAGTALFAERLAPFYAARPQFAPLAVDVEAFYAASRRAFFAADDAPVAPDLPRLVALCRRLARKEAGG